MCVPVAGMRERGSLLIARLDKGFVAHLLVPGKGGACVSDRCDASAHALRLWVTTISAEWLQIKHRNTHQAAALRQILEAKEGLRIQAGP